MLDSSLDQLYLPQRRNVRLDTLLRLRWLAIIGQTMAVLVVYYGFEFPLPIWACLAVIALSAWLNVALRIRFTLTQRLEPERAAWLLAFDIAELAVLLFLTGGLQNPFAFLFLSPVLLSATALPPRITLMLGGFAVVCATVLVFIHYPLPWDPEDPLELPWIYMTGVWFSIMLAIGYISVYAWQLTEEGRQLAEALAATELVLEREQHLSQLDGLAAAAAHELGYPGRDVCIKPVVSAGSRGFHVLSATIDRRAQLLTARPGPAPLSLEDAAAALGDDPTELLVMELVTGLERTVDGYARGGEVLFAHAKTREELRAGLAMRFVALDDPALVAAASAVVGALCLDGFFNVQFIGGALLEVNPRISTIVYQEDLNLPYLGVKRAIGEISDEELVGLRSRIRLGRSALRYFDQVEFDVR